MFVIHIPIVFVTEFLSTMASLYSGDLKATIWNLDFFKIGF